MKTTIAHSGQPGSNGTDGFNGSSGGNGYSGTGGHGTQGSAGTSGKNGGPITVNLDADKSSIHIDYKAEHNSSISIPFSEAKDFSLSLISNGGQGGNGGDGGNGGEGGSGRNGANATQYTQAGRGDTGGTGGSGGDGGNAGNGGDGGDITVHVDSSNTDLLMLIDTVDVSGGKGGNPGLGGKGGRGGPGGNGGYGCSWSEYRHNPGFPPETIYRTNPPGSSGSSGSSGSTGRSGQPGSKGKDGSYVITVTDTNISYTERYNLIITGFDPLYSVDGIFEPGETIKINNIKVQNNGQMPLPHSQQIKIGIASGSLVSFNQKNLITLSTPLSAGATHTLTEPLKFSIKENHGIKPNQAYCTEAIVRFSATMTRVNIPFENVGQEYKTIQIRYPVELSTVSGVHSISRAEEAPFALQIRNISTLDTGAHATQARSVKITMRIPDINNANALTWVNNDGQKPVLGTKPIDFNVVLLPKQSSLYLSGTLKFTNPATPLYTNVQTEIALMIDDSCVQLSTHSLQLSESYSPDKDADFVLVINAQTKSEEVQAWKKLFNDLGGQLTIWNVSLYSGIDYNYRRQDGSSFFDELKDKVMIILNREYQQSNDKTIKATDYLTPTEVFTAAKNANISTYIIGSGLAMTETMVANPVTLKTEVITKSYGCFSRPAERDLRIAGEKLANEASKKDRTHHYGAVYEYNPKNTGWFFFSKYELGKVHLKEGLPTSNAKIAYLDSKEKDAHVITEMDIFNVFKLLPLHKKLKYLSQNPSNTILPRVILSDLADEQKLFRQDKWSGDLTKDNLAKVLMTLNELNSYDMSSLHNDVKKSLLKILLQYEHLVIRLPSRTDNLLYNRRGRVLTNISLGVINDKLTQLGCPSAEVDQMRTDVSATYNRNTRYELMRDMTTPLDIFQSHTTLLPHFHGTQVLSQRQVFAPKKVPSNIVEGAYNFSNQKTAATRKPILASFEKECRYTSPKPVLYTKGSKNVF